MAVVFVAMSQAHHLVNRVASYHDRIACFPNHQSLDEAWAGADAMMTADTRHETLDSAVAQASEHPKTTRKAVTLR